MQYQDYPFLLKLTNFLFFWAAIYGVYAFTSSFFKAPTAAQPTESEDGAPTKPTWDRNYFGS